jgi:diaminopimelate decarboxylase
MSVLKKYQPPVLRPLAITSVGKHDILEVQAVSSVEESHDYRGLLAEYGSPLFVVFERRLRAQYRSMRDTFTARGVDTVIAYSYKTNYLPAVCTVLHQEGAWAEVVSGMEYELARALGMPGKHIIFNGPLKTPDELRVAIADGALINVDGFDDLAAVRKAARAAGRAARIGLRFNFRHGANPWTKFGFNVENGDCRRALEMVAGERRLRLDALHNHSGTFQVDPKIYGRAASIMVDVARQARALGLAPTVADFGGGYPSGNRLKQNFDPSGGSGPRTNGMAPFAELILNRICAAREVFGGKPTIVLEPGRALVDEAVQLLCTVVATKEIPGQGPAVIIDAGVNILPTAYWYDHEVDVAPSHEDGRAGMFRPVNIYGPLCMQIDVVRERASLPPLSVGAPLVIGNVGAYCLSQSMQFIQPRPAVAMLGPNGVEVIRRRETWRDIFALDAVPKRLRLPRHAF